MTVISDMLFNANEGAMVADEQSTGARKSELATKIHVLSNDNEKTPVLTVIGGTGLSDFLYEISQEYRRIFELNKAKVESGVQMAELLASVMADVKRKYLNGYLKNKYGVEEADIHRGFKVNDRGDKEPIGQFLTEQYMQIVNSNGLEINQNRFLILTSDKDGVNLYSTDTQSLSNAVPSSQPYASAGSGSDMADEALYEFFEKVPRESRRDINPVDGISALLYATERASKRNVGVGGTPMIAVVKEGKVIIPNERSSRLALEIVKGTKAGYLSKAFENESLAGLVYGDADFNKIEKAMWEEAKKDKDNLSLLLRGYKV
ncbi:hypothetical protein KY330_03555 [Candidatus Woesearchaeota archaeon]|nr:hypothetical protein [Candidatus Woesearchaeota archaeon]